MMRWLTRLRLKRDAPAAALARVLLPDDPSARCHTAHRLLWTLFADDPDRRRDFLWREERPDRGTSGRAGFLVLSAREPVDEHGLFKMDPSKPWAPSLAAGDRLAFSLRANPVVTRKGEDGRSKRHDVVMDCLRNVPSCKRAEARPTAVWEAGLAWLDEQGRKHGFRLEEGSECEDKAAKRPLLRIAGYEQVRIARDGRRDRERQTSPALISMVELDGVLRVSDPDRFLAAVNRGFGKAKAFGCGLMLIRRA